MSATHTPSAKSQPVDSRTPKKGAISGKALARSTAQIDDYTRAELSGDYSAIDMTEVTSICPPYERKSELPSVDTYLQPLI